MNRWKDRKGGAEAETGTAGDGAPADEPEPGRAGAPGEPGGAAESPADTEGEAAGPAEDPSPLERELADLKDRHLRLAAEFENFRKRTRRESAAGRTLAQAELVQQILPTLDDLARVADTPHENTTVQALDEGIELILRNFRKQLADAGLQRIEALDQPFDPERHQAVTAVAVSDPELDGTVSRVFVDGYEVLGRLVRPAQVEVRHYEESAGAGDE